MNDPFDARERLRGVTVWLALVGAAGIMLLAGAVVVDVFMRVAFNAPILGVDDLTKLALAVIVSSFFPVGLVGGHFVTIRFLGKAIGPRGGAWLEVVGGVCTLLVFVILAWQFFRFTLYDVAGEGLATVVLELPQAPWWWVVTAVVVACVPLQTAVVFDAVMRAVQGRPAAYDSEKDQHASSGA